MAEEKDKAPQNIPQATHPKQQGGEPTPGQEEEQRELQALVDQVSQQAQREIVERELVGSGKRKKRKKGFPGWVRQHKKLTVAVLVCLVAAGGGMIYVASQGNRVRQSMSSSVEQATAKVERRNIKLTLSGSGTLQAADSYTITSLVEGEILSAQFEEGDVVEKDTVLYEVDSSDISSSIEQAEISLEKSQRDYERTLKTLEDLNVKASEAGSLVSFEVEPGDEVKAGDLLATIRNQSVMSLTLPFSSDDAAGFAVGDTALVTVDGSFEQVEGTISKVMAVDDVLTGNRLVRQVTIDVANPGGITSGQAATATVGEVACAMGGTFAYKGESQVTAPAAGTVSSLQVAEGAQVEKDQVLLIMTSEDLENSVTDAENSVKNAQISLENQQDKLDNYSITSPIAGTIIEKYYKTGDTMEAGKTLCTIFDLSYLTVTMNIDELDIGQIEVGQEVTVTAEAAEGQVYQGVVTKVNINGTTQNGVTSYPVTIQIDETDGLLPGMNVDAVIQVESRENVLTVPVSAVNRGNRVLVKRDEAVGSGEEDAPEQSDAPEGYVWVTVETGISDEDYIEITSGLEEGEEVAYTPIQGGGSESMPFGSMGGGDMSFTMGMGGNMGGSGGGGRPAGGGPGGGF